MKNQASLQLLKVGAPIKASADTGHIMLTAAADGSLKVYDENGNGIPIGGSVTVDTELSTTSTNPVQNGVITAALNAKIADPGNGVVGQLLAKSGSGYVWIDSSIPNGSESLPLLNWGVQKRGNDSDTKFLLQPSVNNNELTDTAYGTSSPVGLTNINSVTSDASGNISFGTAGYLKITANALPSDVLKNDHEWFLETQINITDVSATQYVFGRCDSTRLDILIRSGYLSAGALYDNWSPITTGAHRIAYEYYLVGSTWTLSFYLDGELKASRAGQLSDYRAQELRIGNAVDSQYNSFSGTMQMLRISNKAPYKGTSYTPQALPLLPTVEGWEAVSTTTAATLLGVPSTTKLVTRYEGSLNADTNVFTIADGTDVNSLNAGDEIIAGSDVYIKKQVTGVAGTGVVVSGLISPTEANGNYLSTGNANEYKHESADYYIYIWNNTNWVIANTLSILSPGASLCYSNVGSGYDPWGIVWQPVNGSGTETTTTQLSAAYDTVDYFWKVGASSGGSSTNVVVSATEPTNATEGTIWIQE